MTGPLLAAADLEVRRQRAEVLILDATVDLAPAAHDGDHRSGSGLSGWHAAHIPGSRHADLLHALSDKSAPYHFAVPAPDALAAALTELGVRDGVPVVTYDRSGGLWAARLWYLLDWLGIESYVLDGGFAAWRSANLPVATTDSPASLAGTEAPFAATTLEAGRAAPAGAVGSLGGSEVPLGAGRGGELAAGGRVTVRVKDGRWVGKRDLDEWLAGGVEATVLCALNPEAYAGEVPTRYSRRGHIPGSGNLPARSLTGADGRFLPEPELRAALGDLVDDPAPVWLYCGGGISATVVALALSAVGRTDVALYDGSLEEWSADPALPLTLGREPA
ncbi:sulfurtransferase [Actinoplanes sp. NPDC020271]|uniref:sulfurtransferase n=1 Tax=Actinoplanes sp. NPDC020271 TaxID=3363896 RepID=UPI00379A7C0A